MFVDTNAGVGIPCRYSPACPANLADNAYINLPLNSETGCVPEMLSVLSNLKRYIGLYSLLVITGCAANESHDVAFSPNQGATDLVVKNIVDAQESICMAAYSFTSKPIANALIKAHKRGVEVRVIVDKSQAKSKYGMAAVIARQGVPVRVDCRYSIMHNKFIVFDDKDVETGSFNFTAGAERRNAENAIVIKGDNDVTGKYKQQCELLWNESKALHGK